MAPSPELRKRLIVAAYAMGVALLILLLPASFTAPARLVFTEGVGPAQDLVFQSAGDALATTGTLRDAFLAEEKARALQRRLERLRNRNVRLKEMVLDRQRRLREYTRLELSGPSFRVISARVTGYDSTAARRSIVVRAGTTDGVREGFAVTAAGALVGTVSRAGPWHSRVKLITDVQSRVACRVQRTRSLCVLRGTGAPNCTVEWVRRDAKLAKGDLLVTSPVADVLSKPPILPAGLPAASIVRADPGRTQPLFQDVSARPCVDPSRLEMVQLIAPVTDRTGAEGEVRRGSVATSE